MRSATKRWPRPSSPCGATKGNDTFRGMYLKAVRMGAESPPDNRIDVQGPGAVTIVLGTDLGRVNGSVFDAQGKQVIGAVVTLVPDQSAPRWYGSRRTDY